MENYQDSLKRQKLWHVPCSIATLAMGIYLSLVCLVPSFGGEYHEIIFSSSFSMLLPFVLLVLIGSPVYALWYYTKLDTDEEFRALCYDLDND